MIILESRNRIVEETLRKLLTSEKRESADVKLDDFDDTNMRIFCDPQSKNLIQVSVSLSCVNEIKNYGADDVFNEVYGPLVTQPADGYDYTLQIDLDNMPEPADQIIEKVSQVRSHLIGAPLKAAFKAASGQGSPPAPFVIHVRYDALMYVVPESDRTTVVWAIDFKDQTDRAIARTFMFQFGDANRYVSQAPICGFSKDPPREIESFQETPPQGIVGYVSFVMTTRHMGGDKMETAINQMTGFRSYILYHIKCSKAYLHSRMRARVDSLLQVLNRAIPDRQTAGTKTISGKTFTRK